MRWCLGLLLAFSASCSLASGAIAPGDGSDGGAVDAAVDGRVDDALPPRDGSRDTRSDTGPTGDAAPDAPALDTSVDAGPGVPTELITVADSGGHDGHPTVIWDGSRFVVAVVVAASGGAHIEVFTMRPSDVTPLDRHRVSSGGARDRRGTELVAGPGGRLAVGWHEWDGAEWDVVVVIEGGGSSVERRFHGAIAAPDHGSVALFWEGSELVGVVREAAPGSGELAREVRFDPAPVAAAPAPFVAASTFGGIDGAAGGGEMFVVLGALATTFWHTGTTFLTIDVLGIPGAVVEASTTVLGADGSVFSLWLGDPGSGRRVYARRIDRVGATYVPAFAARDIGWLGPDPTVAALGDRVVGAFVDESAGRRTVTVAMLDRDANPLGGPCALVNERPAANDPVIACGGRYCTVVWIEATAYGGSDFITRVVQLPAEPELLCP